MAVPGTQILRPLLRAKVRTIETSGFTKISALGVEEQRVNVVMDFVDDPGRLAMAIASMFASSSGRAKMSWLFLLARSFAARQAGALSFWRKVGRGSVT